MPMVGLRGNLNSGDKGQLLWSEDLRNRREAMVNSMQNGVTTGKMVQQCGQIRGCDFLMKILDVLFASGYLVDGYVERVFKINSCKGRCARLSRKLDWCAHVCSILACVMCVMVVRWFKHIALSVLLSGGGMTRDSNLLQCTM